MVIEILYYILLFYACVIVLYSIYKVIWYTVIMLSFPAKMKRLSKKGVQVEHLRKLTDIVFGRKGDPDYYVTVGGKRLAVGVIGPRRMNYQKVIEMINHLASGIDKMFGDASIPKLPTGDDEQY